MPKNVWQSHQLLHCFILLIIPYLGFFNGRKDIAGVRQVDLRGICSKQTPSSSPFHEHEIWKAKDRDNIICEDLRHILILTPITVRFPKLLFMVSNRSSWVTFVVSFDFVIQFLRHKSATRRKICELCFSYRSSGSHFKSERSQILQSGC